ncbi:MAG: lytic transglycosylase domain-containing protein [Acidobacteriota bacterium]|nr:lytic transglycosylase domain-containing protein [Acidobacteriota bacterium]MDH3522574.1 lytic transglycosylase domain-containing protein [Acidobacteriota bacterium]
MTGRAALLSAALLSAALPSAAAAPGAEPRIEWVALQGAGRLDEALAGVERFLAARPTGAALGAHYLRGRLLARRGRLDDAAAAFAAALAADPQLAPFSRYRLAEIEVERGHPEVAAGLLATLLSTRPSPGLGARAADLLALTLGRGGDCRLLAAVESWSLPPASLRPLRLRRADCTRERDPAAADGELRALLAEDTADGTALEAAERLAAAPDAPDGELALDVAMAFFGQRRFDRAIEHFAVALRPGALPAARRTDFETQYALARSYFWLGDHRRAAESFSALATLTDRAAQKSQALYQRGRALELGGDAEGARAAFAASLDAQPEGPWAAAALTSRLRLAWLDGEEGRALELFALLAGRRSWRGASARAAFFLAAGDLVRGRADRAGAWLDAAAAAPELHLPELAYWQGRLAEEKGDPAGAVQRYRAALAADPFDPWSEEARGRLASPELAAPAARAAASLAASGRETDLLSAWLLAPGSAEGEAALGRLRSRLSAGAAERSFLELAAVPAADWPLWRGSLAGAEERLLALGDWELGAPAAAARFPDSTPPLALTRARAFAENGLTRQSILAAEVLADGAPDALPPSLWPAELTRLLYPLAYGALLETEAADAGLDPRLLAALIREESRFDPRATSAAAARGLTQFVLPTARRLGEILGLGTLDAAALHRPEIAIRLGAAYLAELGARFGGRTHLMLAAYNAGEAQAELWRSYCASDERAEYLSKVGFRETRDYLRKVLVSYARYRELYGGGSYEPVAPSPAAATTPGSGPSTSSK